MTAELQAIQDGIIFCKAQKAGPLRVFSYSTDAVHSIHTDQDYKGVEEGLIRTLKSQLEDPLVKGVRHC